MNIEKFAVAVIRRRKAVVGLFAVFAAICAFLFFTVNINYDMADYLPPQAQSTAALKLMAEEFSGAMPNAEVYARGVSPMEALAIKHKLAHLDHISEVIWLDDVFDMAEPLEMGDKDLIEDYYKNENAKFSVTIEKSHEKQAVSKIRELIGGMGSVAGEAADIEFMQSATDTEVLRAVFILVPVVILILAASTASWVEPLLFLAAIGVSVVINMGTNAFFGSVSFLTNSVTPILSLAVSLDYAIFLLHSFGAFRKSGLAADEAMQKAVKESFSAVSASALTTLFGFAALMFMDFRLGADLGLSLAKGIVLSFVSVMVFLPALTICVYKAIDKTRHREFIPPSKNIYSLLRRVAVPVSIIVAVVIVPAYLGQSQTDFLYGYNSDEAGDDSITALLVPRGEAAKEELLCADIQNLPYVSSVMSYVKTVGFGIPPEFLDADVTGQFYSANLARIIVYANTPKEGDIAFESVGQIAAAAEKYYPGQSYLAGSGANLYDIKTVVQNDNRLTDLIATVSIFAVILLTFKSAALPFFLLLAIKAAIWINLSIPYFGGTSINYIGYLIINTVQLGATIDYAVLLSVAYMRNRQILPKREAMHEALGNSFNSILVSATTLSAAGFILALTSSNSIIGDIGMLLGRGALLSMAMVAVCLPVMLTAFDGFIGKTTLKSNFYISDKK